MIKEGFVLRKMPGMNLVMPIGENVKTFNGALMLNDTGALVYEELSKNSSTEEIARRLTEEYNVSLEQAVADVKKTIDTLREAGVAE